MECIRCGHQNSSKALYCNLCGESLASRREGLSETMPGPQYGALPSDDELKRLAEKARQFLLLMFALLSIPAAAILIGWKSNPDAFGLSSVREHTPYLIQCLIIYGCMIHALLVAMTGKATGSPFWVNFSLALFPPLVPAVWSRIAGRPPLRPYIYMAIDAVILALGYLFLRDWPYMLLLLSFSLLPFLIYQLLGCAIGPVTRMLGYYPGLSVVWLCFGPIALLGILFWESMSAILQMNGSFEPWTLSMAELRSYAHYTYSSNNQVFVVILALYATATMAAWIKAIYEDLKLPNL